MNKLFILLLVVIVIVFIIAAIMQSRSEDSTLTAFLESWRKSKESKNLLPPKFKTKNSRKKTKKLKAPIQAKRVKTEIPAREQKSVQVEKSEPVEKFQVTEKQKVEISGYITGNLLNTFTVDKNSLEAKLARLDISKETFEEMVAKYTEIYLETSEEQQSRNIEVNDDWLEEQRSIDRQFALGSFSTLPKEETRDRFSAKLRTALTSV